MTAEEKSVLSLFMIGVLIVVGKVLAGGEPITPRLFIGRMLLGGFVSMVAGVVLDDQDRTIAALLRTDNRREIGAIDIAALDLARFSLQVHVLLLYFM